MILKKKDSKQEIFYNEEEIDQTTNQIMGAYVSGIINEADGQVSKYDQDE